MPGFFAVISVPATAAKDQPAAGIPPHTSGPLLRYLRFLLFRKSVSLIAFCSKSGCTGHDRFSTTKRAHGSESLPSLPSFPSVWQIRISDCLLFHVRMDRTRQTSKSETPADRTAAPAPPWRSSFAQRTVPGRWGKLKVLEQKVTKETKNSRSVDAWFLRTNRHSRRRRPTTVLRLRTHRTAPALFLRYLCYLLFEIRISDCLLFHVRMDRTRQTSKSETPADRTAALSPAVWRGSFAQQWCTGRWGNSKSWNRRPRRKRRIRDLLMLGFFALIITPGDGGQ